MSGLYSIGHSHHKLEYFFALLRKHNINYLLDVRSTPYSKYAADYNREHIAKVAEQHKIQYFYMGDFFGARPKNKDLYNTQGFLDFERVRASELFEKGVASVLRGLDSGYGIAMMCTEKEPIDCHRAILVARGFALRNVDVKHILANGEIQLQSALDTKLLDMYFPERYQASLFETEQAKSDDELLVEAYRMRNKEIGYHLTEE